MKKLTSKLLVFLSLILWSNNGISQDADNFWDQVRFGGGIGLSFGNGFFSGTLAPAAIYEVNPALAFGVGVSGSYNSLKDEYNSTILGASLLSYFNPIPQIQLSAEFEQLNVDRNFDSRLGIPNENYWYPALFIGAGYSDRNVTVGIRYDVLYDSARSIYADAWMPFVRVFF